MLNLELYRRGFLPESRAGERLRTVEHAGVIELSADDLPAVCPHASMPLWALHPRVFLDVVNQNEAMCPYCGTRYCLRPDAHAHDHESGARGLHQHRKQDKMDADPQCGTAIPLDGGPASSPSSSAFFPAPILH